MKAKRILAMLLSVAMIASSGDIPGGAGIVHADNSVYDTAHYAEDVSERGTVADEVDIRDSAWILDDGSTTDGNGEGSADGQDVQQVIISIDSEYFALTGDYALTWKPGVSIDTLRSGLTVELPKEAEKIPTGIFDNNTKIVGLTIPEDSALKEIAAGAFEKSGIRSIKNLPAAVTEIKEATFKNAKSLSSVTFAEGSKLKTIGKEAFEGTTISSIAMPNDLTEIGESAFKNCTSLATVNLKNTQVIGEDAFMGCSALTENGIGWSNSLKEIKASAFASTGIKTLTQLGSLAWAGTVTWGENVFAKCTSLTKVTLHEKMTSIPNGMFSGCTALTTITISKNCASIGDEAFDGCTALKKVTIPENVNRIGSRAFGGCQNLTEVTIKQKGSGSSGESDIIIVQDAFPEKTMTMKGYDGTVEDYADQMGYTFTTLFEKHKITVDKGSNGSVELSTKSALAGKTIEVKVTPDVDYRLKASSFTYNDIPIDTLKSSNEATQTFTFVMPDEDVEVYVRFEKTSVSYGTLSATFEKTDEQVACDYNKSKKILTMDKVGHSCKLVVASSKGVSYNPGSWLFDYKSSNTKIAMIDSEGVIYARGVGTATITATLKTASDSKVSFKVTVSEEANADRFGLVFSGLGKGKWTKETIAGTEYNVISYTKANLSKAEKDFTVTVRANSGDDTTNLLLPSNWTVNNTDLAYIESDKDTVQDNTNVIHIKKGVTGETSVKVTVTNGLTEKNKVTYYTESFILRIIDPTPRLGQKTITVNALSSQGTAFELISVYGYDVVPTGLGVVKGVTKKGITEYQDSSYVTVKYSGGKHYMLLTDEGKEAVKKKSGTLTYDNMYIEGEYTYTTDYGTNTETFRTPIESLVLTNKALKPTISTTGKINLFYNNYADVENSGSVTLKQSLTTLDVSSYELVSEANYKKEGTEAVDSFANNFVVNDDGVITRSTKDAIYDSKGSLVASGYLKINYTGYEPCYVKLTIPTQTTKPGLVLSATKSTINTLSGGYEIKLQVLDKKTKKAISLNNLAYLGFDETAKGVTPGLFEAMDVEAAREQDVISLRVRTAQKGRAAIAVRMYDWSDPMNFNFDLKLSTKLPTVKVKPSTITLNNLCVGQTAAAKLTLNQTDVILADMRDPQFTGKASLMGDASQIHFEYADGQLFAYASSEVKAGSYKFAFTPVAKYATGQQETLKQCKITVKVVNTKLTMSLKPAKVTMNNLFVGQETGVTKFTIKNLPSTTDGYDIVSDQVTIAGANASAVEAQNSFAFSFGGGTKDGDDAVIKVQQTKPVRKAGSYKYKISGLQVAVGSEQTGYRNVTVQPFALTVKVINKNVKLNAKASGSLNISNSDSAVTYSLAMVNTETPIESVVVQELNSSTKTYGELTNFDIAGYTMDGEDITGVLIKANDDVTLDAKKTYKIRIGAKLKGSTEAADPVWSSALTVKLVQTMPKIKTDVSSATMYAGASIASGKRTKEVLITKTTEKDSEISSVVVSTSNSKSVQNAFAVTFDPDTQKASITLIRPDLLKANTEYAVKFDVKVVGQLANTTGAQFTLNVTVMN